MNLTDRHIADLLREATTSNKAWNELVLAFSSQVKWAIRSHGLTPLEQEEAARATWASLAEHLGELRDAGEVAPWLTTRAHIACLNVRRSSGPGAAHRALDEPTSGPARRRGPDRRQGQRAGADRRHGPRVGADRHHTQVISGGDSPDTLAARLTRRELSLMHRELPDPA